MKSLEYLEEIMKDYVLSKSDLADIAEKLSYVARDNGEDDTILCDISEELTK